MDFVKKHKHLLVSVFLILWTFFVLVILYLRKEHRVEEYINKQIEIYKVKYDFAYDSYKYLSENMNRYIIHSKDTIEILRELNGADEEKLLFIRGKLLTLIEDHFLYLKNLDFRQVHFHLKDNRSFLRLHEPSMYGDKLDTIRYGVAFVNKNIRSIDGFEHGRKTNGFRYIYPIFDEKRNHLGSVEFSIKAKGFIKKLRTSKSQEIHLLVKKSIVDSKSTAENIDKYYTHSSETPLYYLEKKSDIDNKKTHEIILEDEDIKENIALRIKQNKLFTLYNNKILVLFMPVKNIEGETAAFFVIYLDAKNISNALLMYYLLSLGSLIILFILLYIIRKDFLYNKSSEQLNKKVKYQHDTLQVIVYVLNELVSNHDFKSGVKNSLKKVIDTLDVDRVYIFENHLFGDEAVCSQRFESVKEGVSIRIDNQELQNISYGSEWMSRWRKLFIQHKYIDGLVRDFQSVEREMFEAQDIKSILVMPIWYKNKLWGFIGFDDCKSQREWQDLEKDVLGSLANAFVSALNKEMYSIELKNDIESKINDLREKDKQLIQQSKLVQMGEMIGMIAHQWRQPLNAISATGINLSLLSGMKMLEDKKVQESSEFIQEQCQKMSATIDTFMNFVKPAKESKPFLLSHTIESVMQIMGAQLSNHNIEVDIKITDNHISIVGHEDLLEQVIINILSNARDSFGEIEKAGKYINIIVDMRDTVPVILIQDNAGGIDEDIRDKIFNPYFTTKEQGKGSGIGLYMSMEIMKKSFNGNLIYKAVEGGSCFEVICRGNDK